MRVVADMVFTVAVISLAAGTVPEFQFGVRYIRSSANGTPVGIGGGGTGSGCLIGTCGRERNCACFLSAFFLKQPAGVDTPGARNHIQYIFSKEQEIVGKSNQREEIVRPGRTEDLNEDQHKIDQCEDPCFHWNDVQKQELGIGVECSVSQKQT